MPKVLNQKLYDLVKKQSNKIYSKPSAYRSGYIVKKYKELGGKYGADKTRKNLKRWFNEKWEDIGHKAYPIYRPTIRVNKHTPLTVKEINKQNLKKQIKLKQTIKGKKNLPKFKRASIIF